MTSGDQRPAGFFSYARADDEHDGGYLTDLRRALAAEISTQTGDDFLIFQDREDILWGQRWKERVELALDATTVLIAVITPRYFKTDACRDELLRFLDREERLGRRDLVLPLIYVDVPGLAPDSTDAVVSAVASRQWVDWRELRFHPFSDIDVRRRVAELARFVVDAINRPQSSQLAPTSTEAEEPPEEAGLLELIAEAEDALPLFEQVLLDFALEFENLTEIVQGHLLEFEETESSPKPAAARLHVARRLAVALDEPAGRLETLANDFIDQLQRVDAGISAVTKQAAATSDDLELTAARELAAVLVELERAAREGLGALEEFRLATRSAGHISSNLRPVLRRIDQAVGQVVPSRDTFSRWANELNDAVTEAGTRPDG